MAREPLGSILLGYAQAVVTIHTKKDLCFLPKNYPSWTIEINTPATNDRNVQLNGIAADNPQLSRYEGR